MIPSTYTFGTYTYRYTHTEKINLKSKILTNKIIANTGKGVKD